jgi:hypothetical protein
MTDQPDDDLAHGRERKAQEALYEEALDSTVTEHAINWLCRAHMLLRISGDNMEAAQGTIHSPGGIEAATREYRGLSDTERSELLQEIGDTWAFAVGKAVRTLWHAARVPGFKPDTLDPKHVAMTAATYLGSQDQKPAAGDDVDEAA